MTIFALVDCNNFYASCERLFAPQFKNRPIIVLSNNDGCIVARSNEAKVLGIPLGAPAFKHENIIRAQGVKVYSSNYELYGDISERVMNTIRQFISDIEIYSIDEAFLRFDRIKEVDPIELSKFLRKTILQWTGIPTSIGIGATKTLAKIANRHAKKNCEQGVFRIDESNLDEILKNIPIEDIWGIANRTGKSLRLLGIKTAHDLRVTNPRHLRSHFSVVMEKIIYELNGVSCFPLEEIASKKSIIASRSFGKSLTECGDIEQALSTHVARAAVKARSQNSLIQMMTVFLNTSRFNPMSEQYYNSKAIHWPNPTYDTGYLIKQAKCALRKIFVTGYKYKKTGVIFHNLVPNSLVQQDLFSEAAKEPKNAKIMLLMDKINRNFGNKTLFFAAEGVANESAMRCDMRSPRYTPRWKELVQVK